MSVPLVYKDAPFDTVVIQPWLAGPGVMYSRNIAAFTQSLALGSNFVKETDTPLKWVSSLQIHFELALTDLEVC